MRTLIRFAASALLGLSLLWAQAPATAKKPAAPASAKAPNAAVLDINTATAEQLQTIPGIGDAYAKKIIAGRPYRAKSELVQKKILPSGVYEKVKDRMVAHRKG